MYEILKEENAIWDEVKKEIFDQVTEGAFNIANNTIGDPLAGEWWYAINRNGEICGYGWVWQDVERFEVSLVVDKAYRKEGIGEKLLRRVELSAISRGVDEIIAVVQPENTNAEQLVKWLYKQGYSLSFNNQLKSEEFAINVSKKRLITLEMVKKLNN